MEEYGLYIDGKWEKPRKETFESINPANGDTLGTFIKGIEEDVIRAVDAAEKAFPKWKHFPAPKRGEILLRVSAILRQRKEELGTLVTKEMGKVMSELKKTHGGRFDGKLASTLVRESLSN